MAIYFGSDNYAMVHEHILNHLARINHSFATPYGADTESQKLQETFNELFQTPCKYFLTATGTAANCIGIASFVDNAGIVFCHQQSHIQNDEAGAVELITGGAKLVAVGGDLGKIDPDELEYKIQQILSMLPHQGLPQLISISQSTETGQVYSRQEINLISQIAKKYDLILHMDGARIANALCTLNASIDEITWKLGVDVLSFGGTKNGALCSEAVLLFNKKGFQKGPLMHKKMGQLFSKSRYIAAQFSAYLENDLWLKNAKHANNMANKLQKICLSFPNIMSVQGSVQANEVFLKMQPHAIRYLQEHDVVFYVWDLKQGLCRFVTSFQTTNDDINSLEQLLKKIRI